jgi:hypothetical protein
LSLIILTLTSLAMKTLVLQSPSQLRHCTKLHLLPPSKILMKTQLIEKLTPAKFQKLDLKVFVSNLHQLKTKFNSKDLLNLWLLR